MKNEGCGTERCDLNDLQVKEPITVQMISHSGRFMFLSIHVLVRKLSPIFWHVLCLFE